jgi:thioredoxin reductase
MSSKKRSKKSKIHDYLILGAGPAGLQMGYCLKKAGRDFKILEAGERAGAFFEVFPRHGMLISSNKVYTGYDDPETNLRFDWNSLLSDDPDLVFKNYSREYFPPREALLSYLGDYATRFELPIEYGVRIAEIQKAACFEATDTKGNTWRGQRLIIATGLTKPWLPPIPGIEAAESYIDMPVDPEDYANQRVLILGKGNSGFETAENLIATTALIHVVSPNPLQLAWKTHFPGHLRAVNNNFLDTYQLKTQNAVLDGIVKNIEKLADGTFRVSVHYSHADEEHEDLHYDRVLACTGFRFDDSIFGSSCRPAMWAQNRLPEQTSEFESTTVPGLFFAGTLMQMRDYKKATSAFIHGFRYNVRSLAHMLESKYHGAVWPSQTLPSSSVDALVAAILERINRTSALWQLFGFMGDVLILDEDHGARYYHELPVDYVQDSDFSHHRSYFVVTLEFGKIVGDPFNILRNPDPGHAERSTFLHPVVRHYHGKEKIAEVHLLENLLGEWHDPQLHIEPLREFMAREVHDAEVVLA